ncbi:MAG: DNA repair protein RadC [Oscillospiraceae bacterium]
MGEHDNHRQRVYNRFLNEGLAGFEEHNAMEFLLFLSRSRGDTNSLAHSVVNHFGSLANALDAPIEELEKIEGIGHSSAVVLKFIPQMCAYYLESKLGGNKLLDSVTKCGEFFKPKFFGKTCEELYAVALDDKRQVIRCVQISSGTANATSISIQKIVKLAVQTDATGVIIAHNHPNGLAIPSGDDMRMTAKLQQALEYISISLVDHLVFCDDDYVSFASTMRLQDIVNFAQE